MIPRTQEDWASYVASLSGEILWSKAVAANTLSFVQGLQEEGSSGQDITDILLLFALRLEQDGQAVPTDMPGQYLIYPALLKSSGR